MAKRILAKNYRVRAFAEKGTVTLDFVDFHEREYQIAISPLAVDGLCAALKEAGAAIAPISAVSRKRSAIQSRTRLRGAEDVQAQFANLSHDRSFVIGAVESTRQVWARFGLPGDQIFELFIPIPDARNVIEGLSKALLALEADPSDAVH